MNADLAAVLASYPPSARPARGPKPLGNAGGLSGARLWRFDSARGPLAARLWPRGGPGIDVILRIHRWIERADRLGFVPIPVKSLDGSTAVERGGRTWEVAPWMTGSARTEPPAPGLLASAFAGLAAFHAAMGEATPHATSPGLAARAAEIDGLLSGDLDRWRRVVAGAPADEARSLALSWIEGASRLAPAIAPEIRRADRTRVTIRPVLRDARPDHFLFEGDRLSGLVDFGAMGVDAASADLARLMAEWIGDDPPSRRFALDAYESARPLDAAEVALIDAFERSAALLAGARWVRWHFVERREFDDPLAAARGLRRAVEKQARLQS